MRKPPVEIPVEFVVLIATLVFTLLATVLLQLPAPTQIPIRSAATPNDSVPDARYLFVDSAETPFTSVMAPPVDPLMAPDAAAPPDPPPTAIQVGPFGYRIHWRTDKTLPDAYGATYYPQTIILLQNGLSPSQLRETLTHELLHACTGVGNYLHTNDDVINDEAVAPTLLQVIHDNPKLMRWLAERKQVAP